MEYFLGLDIGTNSVGWAVTDKKLNLIRKRGQNLWGVRLFDDGVTAVDRRAKRSARRNRARKKLMRLWLQEVFAPEIEKIDKDFFVRLNNSAYYAEDKDAVLNGSKNSVFTFDINGNKYTDVDYFDEYPTIYKLRSDLLNQPTKDIRLLYLAVYNIIKSRGHFYTEFGEGEDNSLNTIFERINTICAELEIQLDINTKVTDQQIVETIKNNRMKTDQKNSLVKLLSCDSGGVTKKVIESFVSGGISISQLFGIDKIEGVEDKVDLSDIEKYTAQIAELRSELTEQQIELLDNIRVVFDNIQLKRMLGKYKYVCQAKLAEYEKYKQQLKMFKSFIKKYYPDKYFDMFRKAYTENDKQSNYSLYTDRLIIGGKHIPLGVEFKDGKYYKTHKYQSDIESFYKYVKSIIDTVPQNVDEQYEQLKAELKSSIDNKDFLVKLRNKSNSSIPNSLLKNELKQILKTNAQNFEFLNKVDSAGISNMDKILSIMSFRVPYFVGPITNKDNSKNSWSKVGGNICDLRPWNIEKMINFDESETNFISRMTNSCTYLKDEEVLPKNSVLFSKFKVLNELNKMSIDGRTFDPYDENDVKLKQKIFNELFLTQNKVSKKSVVAFLKRQGYENAEIGGIDGDFKSNMTSYIRLKSILGEDIDKNNLGENIVKYHTIMEDKKRVIERLKKEYPYLTEDQLKKIKGLSFEGWGSLSKKFLQDLFFIDQTTGERLNIIDTLWNTNQNLQQILFNENYTLREILNSLVVKNAEEITYDEVEKLYCSPAVKRGVWQTILIINHLKQMLGDYPDKIFIETTRHDEKKGDAGRKSSRLATLQKMYKDKKSEITKLVSDYKELEASLNSRTESDLREKKLYLYYLQNGKCAYSCESLDLDGGLTDCDIEHIIPRCFVKDDSIDNIVLVKSKLNKAKGDTYPLYPTFVEWQNRCIGMWKNWLKQGAISQKKYDKLVRRDPLTAEDHANFINRQLVETNQSVSAVIQIMKCFVKNEKDIVYSKAEVVSDFRKWHEIPKCREVNDFHHAKDAYLNIVVGNGTRAKFSDNPAYYFKKKSDKPVDENDKQTENPLKIFGSNIYDFKTHELVWSVKKDKNGKSDLDKVKRICEQNDILVSRKTELNTDDAFYKETIHKSKKNNPESEAKVQLKGKGKLSNIERYGGYGDQITAYFMLIKSKDKKKEKISFERMTTYAFNLIKSGQMTLQDYLTDTLGLVAPVVLKDRIPLYTELQLGKGHFLISGATGPSFNLHNFNQWHVKSNTQYYVKNLLKFEELYNKSQKLKDKKLYDMTDEKIIVSPARTDKNKELVITLAENDELYNNITEYLLSPLFENVNTKSVGVALKEKYDEFKTFDIEKQSIFLIKLIKSFARTNSIMCDLSVFTENKAEDGEKTKMMGKYCGTLKISRNATDENYVLIKRNPLGFIIYKEEIGKL